MDFSPILLYLRVVLFAMAAMGSFYMMHIEYQRRNVAGTMLNTSSALFFCVLGAIAIFAPESSWHNDELWNALRSVGLTGSLGVLIPLQWAVIFLRVKGRF